MRTIVYVDAFNLYYGCLKDTPYRWLDLPALCRALLPTHDILRVKYYTARVASRPDNPGKPTRQQAYLRALVASGPVEIVYGHYARHVVRMPLAQPVSERVRFVEVLKTEEKGSDVNLATHLVADAYEDAFDVGVLITNDSDLLEPMRLVRERLRKKIGLLNPQRTPSRTLRASATFFKQIRPGMLARCQMPDVIADRHGAVRRPVEWSP